MNRLERVTAVTRVDGPAMTVIKAKIRASGRSGVWYGARLGYPPIVLKSGRTRPAAAFYRVVSGLIVPRHKRRKRLADLLGCKPCDLWELNDAGELVARRVGLVGREGRGVFGGAAE